MVHEATTGVPLHGPSYIVSKDGTEHILLCDALDELEEVWLARSFETSIMAHRMEPSYGDPWGASCQSRGC